MMWRDEVRKCTCGNRFAPKREAQVYCSKRCANAATQRRKRSGDIEPPPIRLLGSGDTAATPHPDALSEGSTVVWSTADHVSDQPRCTSGR